MFISRALIYQVACVVHISFFVLVFVLRLLNKDFQSPGAHNFGHLTLVLNRDLGNFADGAVFRVVLVRMIDSYRTRINELSNHPDSVARK